MGLVLSFTLAVCAANNQPIVVGASLSLTGPFQRQALDEKTGYEMWVSEVNAHSGLLGRQVQLKIYDDQSDPATSAKLYERLITQDKVDLILGPYATGVTAAAANVAEKYHYVMIAPGASAASIFVAPYKYRFQGMSSQLQLAQLFISLAKAKGMKTVAVIGPNNSFGQEIIDGTILAAKDHGLKVVFQEEYPADTKDMSSIILKMKQRNPDVVAAAAYLPDSILLIQQSKELNFAPKMLDAGPVGPLLDDFVKTLGRDAEDILGVGQWDASAASNGNETFVKMYKTQHLGQAPSYAVATAYQAGLILQQAIEKAGSLDQEKIRQAVLSMNFQGPFGGFKVNQSGAQVAHRGVIIQIQNGRRVTVWPKEIADGQVVVPIPSWTGR
jgi:branched-chain amino acid transport system substrate-binding protein